VADSATPMAADDLERVQARASFLAGREPFVGLSREDLARVAASVVERVVPSGEVVLVESGLPGTELYVIREGAFELAYKQAVVAVLSSGEVFGHPHCSRAWRPSSARGPDRNPSLLHSRGRGLDVLTRPGGVRFVAASLRERLLDAARTMRSLPDDVTRPVTSLVRSAPVFCDANTSVRDAARLMAAEKRSALLVRTAEGLGIVTDWTCATRSSEMDSRGRRR